MPMMPATAPVTAAGVAAGSESGVAFERSVAPLYRYSCRLVPNVRSTWAAVPLASTYMPLRNVFVTAKPCARSHRCTATTWECAGA